jgi:hypothetical protein
MAESLMLLPSTDPARVRLLRVPLDLGTAEAYRFVTGVIADLESQGARNGTPIPVDEVTDALEDRGFEVLDLILGPTLD